MTDRKIIEELVDVELAEANKEYPLFHSAHEAYGVLKEECEELWDDYLAIDGHMDEMWDLIRQDDAIAYKTNKIYGLAINAACEAIQIAAMCKKVKQSDLR